MFRVIYKDMAHHEAEIKFLDPAGLVWITTKASHLRAIVRIYKPISITISDMPLIQSGDKLADAEAPALRSDPPIVGICATIMRGDRDH